MAPIQKNAKSVKGKHFKSNFANCGPSYNANGKRKWVHENKFFDGSLREGQGFALKRKEKIKQQYNKILRKEKWKMQQSKVKLHEEYPEHLKHLYLAEKERLEEEEQEQKNKRLKGRAVDSEAEEEQTFTVGSTSGRNDYNTTPDISADQTLSSEAGISKQSASSHKAQFMQRKQKNVSSYQKTKQEYERIKQEREQKREEFLKNKAQREEAVKKYKEKKMATYQILNRKTKKGQPNLNIQMELLLQKIQAQQQ
ncbi:Thyroid transcription factor 1-associated protein 26 -like protein [Triplophysa tibetana]|uniref:Thyroid transcription factor 1-associated protein 26-like protein n=1 Tax=Triplophysa tibetana TaxID=1572043 RepID=A0A5A9PGP3_9TELE|nr:Thyroid transcription factor 1-associated protein 26 -like protein [Triplophysa tibetana]